VAKKANQEQVRAVEIQFLKRVLNILE